MLEQLFNSPFLYSLSLTLLHFLWQGLLVALVLKSALLIISNKKPQLRYALSSLAMLANFLLPLITFSIIYRAELAFSKVSTSVLTLTELIQELKQTDSLFAYQELTGFFSSFLPYIALLWLASVTLLASKLLIEIYNVNKLPQQNCIEPEPQLAIRFNELAQQLNLTISPKLLISLKVDVPMAIGWLKPVVLIPASMISGLNKAQLEMLILHELAHIRRYDYLVNFLQTFVEILLFFHPAVLWVSKQMRNEREYCSDDIAVKHCGDAVAYAHTLADTATLCTKAHHHHHTIPSLAMAASGGDLKQRVVRLVDHHCAPQNNISKWFASATIIFSVLLLSSKQLLTMPLIDLWHKEYPWQSNTDSTAGNNSSLESNLVTWGNNSSPNQLPNSSIASQLLTPEQAEQTNIVTVEQAETKEAIAAKTPSSITLPTEAVANEQSIQVDNKTQRENPFSIMANTQPASDYTEFKTASTASMVEKAFENTNSHHKNSSINNPYAEELSQLAAEEARYAPSKPISTANQSIANSRIKPQTSKKALNQEQTLLNNELLTRVENSQNNSVLNIGSSSLPPSTPTDAFTLHAEPMWDAAKQVKTVNPVYPSVAKRKGIEIDIKVNFTIDINGRVKDIDIVHQHKANYFKSAIRSAIKQWRFLPAKLDGLPVESQMSKVFAFSLKS